jgi:predicted secreted protein
MSPGRAVATYMIVWVITLFALLPLRVRTAEEEGRAGVPGQMAGAPAHARLLWKAKWTTIVASVVFSLLYLNAARAWVTWADLQWLPASPR